MDTKKLQQKLRDFASERDWNKFHTPKNLSMALAAEAGELLEIFQWKSDEESFQVCENDKEREEVYDELADLQIYLLRLADILGVDLGQACELKMEKNAQKYPASLVRGSSKKYTEY
jgi:NTP pyrophosphatase (non-canonical NTP hydrolase)